MTCRLSFNEWHPGRCSVIWLIPTTMQHSIARLDGFYTTLVKCPKIGRNSKEINSMTETSTQSGGRPSLPMQGVPQPRRDEVLNLPRVHISTHPVMAHKMTALRDKNTQPPEFYRHVKEIGALLAYEATATLALETVPIETPMGPMIGERLAGG